MHPLIDELVVVDDGSTDGTGVAIAQWRATKEHVSVVTFPANRGMSAAYFAAFDQLRSRLARGALDCDDLVFTVDADGQHDLAVLAHLESSMRQRSLDAILARRDLSYHGPFKRWGNGVVSRWASLWAGQRLYDVESGYRIFRLGSLADALDYYRGYRYSETVQVAVVLARLGFRVANDVVVPVPVSRSRTRTRDAVIDIVAIPWAALRVLVGRRGSPPHRAARAGSSPERTTRP